MAVRFGKAGAAAYLLDQGANPDALSSTPMEEAIAKNRVELARLLLERGAQPSFYCWQQAAREGRMSILKLFVAYAPATALGQAGALELMGLAIQAWRSGAIGVLADFAATFDVGATQIALSNYADRIEREFVRGYGRILPPTRVEHANRARSLRWKAAHPRQKNAPERGAL